MIIGFALVLVLFVAVMALLILDRTDEQREWHEAALLPPKERHRRELYLKYLPQSELEAKLLDEAIERGEFNNSASERQ